MIQIPEMVRGEGSRAWTKRLGFDESWMTADEGGWADQLAGGSEAQVFYFLNNTEIVENGL